MKFNKCVRCGAFFSSEDNVCPNCKSKDQVDMSTVKNYMIFRNERIFCNKKFF